jgi:hypothetical protein
MGIEDWTGQVSEDNPSTLTPAGINFLLVRQSVGVLNAQTIKPEMVRVLIKPLQRFDRAPVFPDTPTNGVIVAGMRAGWFNAPGAIPPPNIIATGNRALGRANYVHLTWGVGNAKQHSLVADWPVSGASIEIVADNIELNGICGETPGLSVPAAVQTSRPRFAADLGPSTGRARGQYDSLSLSQLLGGAVVTGTIAQAAVPEFATALQISLGDSLGQNNFEVSWMDPAGQVVETGRYGLSAAANGNLVFPMMLPVPCGAVAMVFTAVSFGALNTTAWAHWRIAP